MRVVQVVLDPVIDMVAVRNCFMTAARAMDMTGFVAAAAMIGSAAVRIVGGDADHVLVDMIVVRMMKMPVVQIVDMVAVADRRMAAIGAVPVIMVGVVGFGTSGHGSSSFRSSWPVAMRAVLGRNRWRCAPGENSCWSASGYKPRVPRTLAGT